MVSKEDILLIGLAGGLGIAGYFALFSKPFLEEIRVQSNQIVLTIKNNSLLPRSFYVGATFVNGSVGGQGCQLNAQGHPYYDLPVQTVNLPPLGTTTIVFRYSNVPFSGLVNLIVKFWKRYDQNQNILYDCFYGESFKVYI